MLVWNICSYSDFIDSTLFIQFEFGFIFVAWNCVKFVACPLNLNSNANLTELANSPYVSPDLAQTRSGPRPILNPNPSTNRDQTQPAQLTISACCCCSVPPSPLRLGPIRPTSPAQPILDQKPNPSHPYFFPFHSRHYPLPFFLYRAGKKAR
jgi:hypothetical protein